MCCIYPAIGSHAGIIAVTLLRFPDVIGTQSFRLVQLTFVAIFGCLLHTKRDELLGGNEVEAQQ
ncbi:hypothetical protein GCM10025751_11760 [Haladaptatus pallidirubidus]|uniref:Uncharacterized protein n=1 Tax=Haladaptatus pallidirubidus TaxID=1008152 RepID=A0AAV3UE99_9EURY